MQGRVALVTGGGRGIGRAIAHELARRGAHVGVNYRANAEAAESCLASISAEGGSAELLPFDVADGPSVASAIGDFADRRGRLDILVNNAGIALDGLLLRYKEDDWQRIVGVNLGGVFHCCKTAATRPEATAPRNARSPKGRARMRPPFTSAKIGKPGGCAMPCSNAAAPSSPASSVVNAGAALHIKAEAERAKRSGIDQRCVTGDGVPRGAAAGHRARPAVSPSCFD